MILNNTLEKSDKCVQIKSSVCKPAITINRSVMIKRNYLEKIFAAAVCFMTMKSFKKADASTKGTLLSCRRNCTYECCGDNSLCGSEIIKWSFFLTALCVLMVCCSCVDANMIKPVCEGGRILQRNPLFLSGEKITLECSNNRINDTARHFIFEWGTEATVVPQEYISQINASTVSVEMPENETMYMLQNKFHTRQVKCVNKLENDDKECIDNIYIQVDYYPETAFNVQCRIYMNELSTMNCSWDLVWPYLHPQHVTVSSYFAASINGRVDVLYLSESEEPCPQQARTWCCWNATEFTDPVSTYLKVTATNTRRNVSNSTEWLNFYTDDIVEPGPVKNLRVIKNENPQCLTLHWEPVKPVWNFVFKVIYKSACSQMQETKMMLYSCNVTECGLNAYTNYTFSVSGKLRTPKAYDNRTLVERGHWSISEVIESRTATDKIDVAPKTAPGLYELTATADQMKLIVYWTPLSDCDLHDESRAVKYCVQVNSTSKCEPHPEFVTSIRIPDVKVVNVSIGATNSNGSTAAPEVITVYSKATALRSSELIIECNQTSGVSAVHASIVTKESGAQYTDLKHTLVWCNGSASSISCSSHLQWQELESSITDFIVPVPHCDGYRYGLVTHGYHQYEGQMISTGIQWQPCLYLLGKVPDKQLDGVSLLSTSGRGFTVKWIQSNCQDTKVYIANYTVKYCFTGQKDTCLCEGRPKTHSVPNTDDSFTETNLEAGRNVCVWVAAVSKYGRGPWNDKALTLTISDNSDLIQIVGIACGVVVLIAVIVVASVCLCNRIRKIRERSGVTVPDISDWLNPALLANGHVPPDGEADDNIETSGNVTDDHNYSTPLTESTRLATSTSEHVQQLPGHNEHVPLILGHNEQAPLLPLNNRNAVLLQGNNERTLWLPTNNSSGSIDDSESEYSALTGYEDPQKTNINYSSPSSSALKSMFDSVVCNVADNAEQNIHTEHIQVDRDANESGTREILNNDEDGIHELNADSEVILPAEKCREKENDSHL